MLLTLKKEMMQEKDREEGEKERGRRKEEDEAYLMRFLLSSGVIDAAGPLEAGP